MMLHLFGYSWHHSEPSHLAMVRVPPKAPAIISPLTKHSLQCTQRCPFFWGGGGWMKMNVGTLNHSLWANQSKKYWRSLTNQMGICLLARKMIVVRSNCISSYLLLAMFYHAAFHVLSCFYLTLAIRRSRWFPFFGRFVWDVPTSRPLTPIARNQTSLAQVASCCHPGRCSCLGVTGNQTWGNNQVSWDKRCL